jgi:hypothetical protein
MLWLRILSRTFSGNPLVSGPNNKILLEVNDVLWATTLPRVEKANTWEISRIVMNFSKESWIKMSAYS